MCFVIHPKHPTAKIAKKDILCYKLLWHIGPETRSLLMNYKYKLHSLNDKIVLKTLKFYGLAIINDGYHSFSTRYAAKAYIQYIADYSKLDFSEIPVIYKIHRCIIPKGEQYYFNSESHTLVSTNLIIKEEL